MHWFSSARERGGSSDCRLNSFAPRLFEPVLLKGVNSAEELVAGLSVFFRGVFDGRQLDGAEVVCGLFQSIINHGGLAPFDDALRKNEAD